MNNFEDERKIISISLLSNLGMLFLVGVYWDDWILINLTSTEILDMFQQHGAMFNLYGYLMLGVKYIGPYGGRLITFLLSICSVFVFYQIIKREQVLPAGVKLPLVLIYATSPFFMAKVNFIVLFYTVCGFLFLLAWLNIEKKQYSLPLFFIAFNTNSFLVFYAVPIALLLWKENSGFKDFDKLLSSLLRNWTYLALPFIYFYLKIQYWAPYGSFEGYNENYIIKAIPFVYIAAVANFFTEYDGLVSLIITLTVILALHESGEGEYWIRMAQFRRTPWVLMMSGMVVLLVAIFPYAAVGLIPSHDDWNSRHQILMPYGSALFFVGIVGLVDTKARKSVILTAILTLSIFQSNKQYYELAMDWRKQSAMLSWVSQENFSESKASTVFVIFDGTKQDNALHRNIRGYEWNAIFNHGMVEKINIGVDYYNLKKLNEGGMSTSLFAVNQNFNNTNYKYKCVGVSHLPPLNIFEKIQFKIMPRYVVAEISCQFDVRKI